MTHTKFIELLNLYLDHQISAEEAALLEGEIQRNPDRLALYRQYCRMQKGCSQLAERFRDQVPVTPGATVTPFPRRRTGWYAGVGALAAAACVALVFVNRPSMPAGPDSAVGADTSHQSQAPVVAMNETQVSARPMLTTPALHENHQTLQTVFSPTFVAAKPAADNPATQTMITQADIDRLDWMNRMQLAPVQLDDYSFQVRPTTGEDHRTYRSRKPFDGNVEMTAFQFQR